MLPRLIPSKSQKASSLEEIFNARQIYISDERITPEYIRYIRPVNEADEMKYKKRYSENETIIDEKIYQKREDQLNYIDFCKICLEGQLINKTKIEYNNKPIISVIIPSYNKKNFLIKSIRSIQNQNFQNIEIIIVNDASTDNSTSVFNYLLQSDPRVRIFHHMTNMGCWRTRLDGILYSRGDYIILFDAGDLYEDNYVLTDAYNIIQKYNLDSCKFLFRVIRSFNYVQNSRIFFHVGKNSKIIYEPENIKNIDRKIFTNWGNIWNRLVRANIYTKAIYLLTDLMLNIHKNVWDDLWFNHIVRRASYSYALYERIGYVYLQDGRGEGSPQSRSEIEKSKIVKEYIGFLYYDYTFEPKNESIPTIMQKLKEYNETHKTLRLQNFRAHFEVLNNLLESLIKDDDVNAENKTFIEGLLKESKQREVFYTGKK
jgi:glycosyltransferase involved in cell wall biosynthesis